MVVRNGKQRTRLRSFLEDANSASPLTNVAVSLRRDDSRIATDLDRHLKATIDNKANGNSAFFSRSEKATFGEILELDSMDQVSDPISPNRWPPSMKHESAALVTNCDEFRAVLAMKHP